MKKSPKILFFDVETKPVKAWLWRTGKQYVDQSQIVQGDRQDIICLSFKWLGSSKLTTLHWDLKKQDSSKMIEIFSRILEEADVALGHNADNFDVKHINTQRLLHGQPPISWPTIEDTLKMIRKQFYLPSYRLDYLAKLLTGSGKAVMTFSDWIEIVENKSAKHLAKMIRYNRRDVLKLEAVYKKVAPFLKPKASRSLIAAASKEGCPSCGSQEHQSKGRVWHSASRKQRRICLACGHNFYVKA